MDSDLPVNLNILTKLILAIEGDENDDPVWRRFYQLQMTSFLLSKKNFEFELDEAEDAYNLIAKTWTDLKTYIEHPVLPINNLDSLFQNISINFPIGKNSISELNNNDELIYGSF